MLVGYARVSTEEQNVNLQFDALKQVWEALQGRDERH
jgi:DNA invertase Pin-like site-specific DNA recombinase